MKKFHVFPGGVEPALESLHEWGVDNLWRQRVPAVQDSDSEADFFLFFFFSSFFLFSFLFKQAGTSKLFEFL